MKKENKILSPVDGEIISLENVCDEVFSSGIMGEGFGVLPSAKRICAPIGGRVENIHRCAHAYSISSEDGFDVLVHIGIDTVELDGECFEARVSVGEEIEAGDLLAKADIDKILEKGFDPVVVVTVSSEEKIENVRINEGECIATDAAMTFEME